MQFLQAILGDVVSIVVVISVIAGISKLFQLAATLTEIKDLLNDIKRNTTDYTPAAAASRPTSPEALVRALNDPDAVRAALYEGER